MDSQAQQSDKALSLNAVSKSFGKQKVLKEISFGLNSNQLTLLLGQNGSGKTTLLRICAGLSGSDSGSRTGAAITKPIAYLGHQCGLYSAMSVRENLALTAKLTKTTINLREFISDWGLDVFADKLVGELSKGQQMRAGLSRAFLRAPSLVLLDEPSAALDDASMNLLL